MKEQLIEFETAYLAYKKGFDISQKYGYSKDGVLLKGDPYGECDTCIYEDYLPAITQSLLQKWLREVHNIEVNINSTLLGY